MISTRSPQCPAVFNSLFDLVFGMVTYCRLKIKITQRKRTNTFTFTFKWLNSNNARVMGCIGLFLIIFLLISGDNIMGP